MKEYIERDAAKKEFLHAPMTEDEKILVIRRIYAIPAADVVEVRHGRWERVDYGNGFYNYHCSSCRHIPRENIRSNYCPNCGADMRGGVNDAAD